MTYHPVPNPVWKRNQAKKKRPYYPRRYHQSRRSWSPSSLIASLPQLTTLWVDFLTSWAEAQPSPLVNISHSRAVASPLPCSCKPILSTEASIILLSAYLHCLSTPQYSSQKRIQKGAYISNHSTHALTSGAYVSVQCSDATYILWTYLFLIWRVFSYWDRYGRSAW